MGHNKDKTISDLKKQLNNLKEQMEEKGEIVMNAPTSKFTPEEERQIEIQKEAARQLHKEMKEEPGVVSDMGYMVKAGITSMIDGIFDRAERVMKAAERERRKAKLYKNLQKQLDELEED